MVEYFIVGVITVFQILTNLFTIGSMLLLFYIRTKSRFPLIICVWAFAIMVINSQIHDIRTEQYTKETAVEFDPDGVWGSTTRWPDPTEDDIALQRKLRQDAADEQARFEYALNKPVEPADKK